jgi:hypothetical protein
MTSLVVVWSSDHPHPANGGTHPHTLPSVHPHIHSSAHPHINTLYSLSFKKALMVIVYAFIGLIILLFIVAALLPKIYNIEKTIIIDKPVPIVMGFVSNLNNYSKWNPWQQSDPTAKFDITGNPGAASHSYSWKGKRVGVGSLTLRSSDSRHIHFDLQFLKPWKSAAKDNWLFETWGENQTKVTWQNSGNFPWPVASLMGPLIKKNLNIQFDKGLQNLKQMVENS